MFEHGDPVYDPGALSGVCKRDHKPLHKAFMLLVHWRPCTIFRVLVQSCPLRIVDFHTPVHDLRQRVVLCTSASICLAGVALVCSQLELQGATVALPFGLMTPAGGSMYVSFPGVLMLLECSMSEFMSKADPVRVQSFLRRRDRFRQSFQGKKCRRKPRCIIIAVIYTARTALR